jgi:hypothetical protein
VQVRRQHHVRGLAEFSEALEARLNTLDNLCLLHLRLLAWSDPADELVHARPARGGSHVVISHEQPRMRYVVAHGKRARKQRRMCSAQGIPPDRSNLDGHVDEEPLGVLPSLRAARAEKEDAAPRILHPNFHLYFFLDFFSKKSRLPRY